MWLMEFVSTFCRPKFIRYLVPKSLSRIYWLIGHQLVTATKISFKRKKLVTMFLGLEQFTLGPEICFYWLFSKKNYYQFSKHLVQKMIRMGIWMSRYLQFLQGSCFIKIINSVFFSVFICYIQNKIFNL